MAELTLELKDWETVRLGEKKQDAGSAYILVKDIHFKQRYSLKVKGWKNISCKH